jgi:hypothetical protein
MGVAAKWRTMQSETRLIQIKFSPPSVPWSGRGSTNSEQQRVCHVCGDTCRGSAESVCPGARMSSAALPIPRHPVDYFSIIAQHEERARLFEEHERIAAAQIAQYAERERTAEARAAQYEECARLAEIQTVQLAERVQIAEAGIAQQEERARIAAVPVAGQILVGTDYEERARNALVEREWAIAKLCALLLDVETARRTAEADRDQVVAIAQQLERNVAIVAQESQQERDVLVQHAVQEIDRVVRVCLAYSCLNVPRVIVVHVILKCVQRQVSTLQIQELVAKFEFVRKEQAELVAAGAKAGELHRLEMHAVQIELKKVVDDRRAIECQRDQALRVVHTAHAAQRRAEELCERNQKAHELERQRVEVSRARAFKISDELRARAEEYRRDLEALQQRARSLSTLLEPLEKLLQCPICDEVYKHHPVGMTVFVYCFDRALHV